MVTMNLNLMDKNDKIILNREEKKCRIIHSKFKGDLIFKYKKGYSSLHRETYQYHYKDMYNLYNFIEKILYNICELLKIEHTIVNFINNHIDDKKYLFIIKHYIPLSDNIEYTH